MVPFKAIEDDSGERLLLKSFEKLGVGLPKIGRKVKAPEDPKTLNWNVLEELRGKTLHGHGKCSLFKLLRILSFFDDDTYFKAREWVWENCTLTANAEKSVERVSVEMFRQKYSCKSGQRELRNFVKSFTTNDE